MKSIITFPKTKLSSHSSKHISFTNFYNEHYFSIYRYACRIIADNDVAKDITADSFIKIWKSWENFSDEGKPLGLLYTITRNLCYDFLKHLKVRSNKQDEILRHYQVDEELDLIAIEAWNDLVKKVYQEVDKMPKRTKEIFLMAFEKGLKTGEIADIIKINVQTVSNQKSVAVSLLKKALSNDKGKMAILLFLLLESVVKN